MPTISMISNTLRPYVNEGVKIIMWFFLAAAVIIFALHSLVAIVHPYSLDYGEAPLIDQATRLASGQNIYRPNIDTPPYTIANYPPLYVISLTPFLNWFNSPFHMGRVISFVATLLSAVFIGLTVHTFTRNRLSSLVAALLFLASPYVVQWAGLARIDSLALAFAMGAIFVFARWPDSRWAWLGGGLLLVAAAYTRQSYALAAPLAAFVWLWTHNKRRAIELVLLVGGLGMVLFLALNTLTDGGFFYNIVTANVNEFGWDRLEDHLSRLWKDAWIILLLSGVFLAIGWRSRKSWALLAPFLVGAFISALTIGKIGSNINYFLELAAALALIAGIFIVWRKEDLWRNAAVIFLIAIQFGLYLQSSMNEVDWNLTPRRADFAHLQLLEREVKQMSDPVLVDEYMGMLTMNDRPIYMQPFEVTQLANAGMWDQQPVLDEISSQNFDGVLIHHFGTWQVYKERWSPEMLAAIEENYRPAKTMAGTVIHIPKGETEIVAAPEAGQRPSATAQPVWDGQTIPVSKPGVLAEPSIAINPTDPDHLVAIVTRLSKQDCEQPLCKVEMAFFNSNDGGETWQERAKFSRPKQVMYNGLVAFNPAGKLYIMGIRNDVIVLNQTSAAEDYLPESVNFEDATRSQVNARPWLRVHPQTGELFLTLDAQESNLLFVTPSLMRSNDGIKWSLTTRADQRISAADIYSPRATGPDDIQALFGEGERVSLVWVWDSTPWNWPRAVWMANSSDGGVTFGEPTKILETWGPINSTSVDGKIAIVYRTGTEESQGLAVAVTSDNGRSWTSTVASGDTPLYFDVDKAPGIGMAPDGTIDLVFYAHDRGSMDCVLDVEGWQQTLPMGRIDPCVYDVYYTFSKDGGLSFAEPVKLNGRPIQGEDFARFGVASRAGSHLSVASGDMYAYPIWIGTPQTGKTQIYSAKIER